MFLRLLGGSTQLISAVPQTKEEAKAADWRACVWASPPAAAAAADSNGASAAPAVDPAVSKSLTSGRLPLPVSALQKALSLYQLRPAPGPFCFAALPHVEIPASSSSSGAGASAADVSEGFGYNSEIR